jgi:two-component system, response regulator PdtaR
MSVISHEVVEAEIRAGLAGPSEPPRSGRVDLRRRILVASDEAGIRSETTQALLGAGFDVVGQADNGRQAASLVSRLGPDLIVLDDTISTPGRIIGPADEPSDHDLKKTEAPYTQLTQKGTVEPITVGIDDPLVPIVLLTAPDQHDVATSRGNSVMAVVSKPVYDARLIPAVEIALARGADIRALRVHLAETTKLLTAHKSIERAKGLLMTRRGMTEAESRQWLEGAAAELKIAVNLVADTIIEQFSAAR